MHRIPLFVLGAAAAAVASTTTVAAQTPSCRDASPHREGFVTVAPGVRLRYLDWGGTGSPLVFLAGLGDTGHEFDAFAPRFIDHHHVYAITRRGFGASSHPASGYDVGTLAHDILVVLDSLRLQRVILIGHSFGGDEMSQFAARWPDRVSGLIYLDAAQDRTGLAKLWGEMPTPTPPAMTAADSASPEGVRRYEARVYGVTLPIGWICTTVRFDSAGRFAGQDTPDSVYTAIISQTLRPPYERIRAPILAFYAVQRSARDLYTWYDAMTPAARAAADSVFDILHPWELQQIALLRRSVPSARVVVVPGANHYVFISNEAEVERAMRAFLTGVR